VFILDVLMSVCAHVCILSLSVRVCAYVFFLYQVSHLLVNSLHSFTLCELFFFMICFLDVCADMLVCLSGVLFFLYLLVHVLVEICSVLGHFQVPLFVSARPDVILTRVETDIKFLGF